MSVPLIMTDALAQTRPAPLNQLTSSPRPVRAVLHPSLGDKIISGKYTLDVYLDVKNFTISFKVSVLTLILSSQHG